MNRITCIWRFAATCRRRGGRARTPASQPVPEALRPAGERASR